MDCGGFVFRGREIGDMRGHRRTLGDTWMVVRYGVSVLDSRTSQLDAIESIERSSIDFYATTRNLYRQSRNAQINDGKVGADDLPNL